MGKRKPPLYPYHFILSLLLRCFHTPFAMECLDRSILERKDLTAARVFLEFCGPSTFNQHSRWGNLSSEYAVVSIMRSIHGGTRHKGPRGSASSLPSEGTVYEPPRSYPCRCSRDMCLSQTTSRHASIFTVLKTRGLGKV